MSSACRLPLTKANLAIANAECPVWQQLRPSTWHLSSRMVSQLLDNKLITLYSFCCRSDFFFPYWNGHFLHLWIWFSWMQCICHHLLSVDLQNAISTVMVFHTALLLIKELTSQKKKCGNGPRPMDFLVSMVEWCFEDSSVMSVRWQYFEQLDICWLYVIWISVQYIVLFPL